MITHLDGVDGVGESARQHYLWEGLVLGFGTVLDSRTTATQICEAVPSRARVNHSTLGSREEKKKKK